MRLLPILFTTTSLALGLAASSCSGGWTPTTGGGPDDPLPASLVGIGVGPNDPTVTLGEPIQFVATGFYDDQTTREVTDTVDWHSSETSVLVVSSDLDSEGRGTTVGSGISHVRCDLHGLESNVVRVIVTSATITNLEVLPPSVQLHSGQDVQLEAEAEFSDGSHGNVTGSVQWITDNGSIATVDSSGRVTAGSTLGTTTIRAVFQADGDEFEATPATVQVLDGSVDIDEADVRILGFSAVSSGGLVTYTVDVKNSGGSPASSFWVDVWLNRTAAPPPPPASGDAYQLVSLLDADATTSVVIELPDTAPGTYQSWVMVDSFNSVVEGSLGENNNIWGPETVNVSGGGGPIGPDLSITYLQAFVQLAQEQVLYIIDVTNTGDQPATNFSVGVFVDPEFPPVAPSFPEEQVGVASIAPGETAYLDLIVREMPATFWQSYVLADSGALVVEPNENNNLAAFQVNAP